MFIVSFNSSIYSSPELYSFVLNNASENLSAVLKNRHLLSQRIALYSPELG